MSTKKFKSIFSFRSGSYTVSDDFNVTLVLYSISFLKYLAGEVYALEK